MIFNNGFFHLVLYPESYEPPEPPKDIDANNHTYDVKTVPKGFQRRYVIRTRPVRCDKKSTLYKLNDKEKKTFTQIPADGCDRY